MKRSKKIYIAKCATVLAVPVILWAYGGGPDPRKSMRDCEYERKSNRWPLKESYAAMPAVPNSGAVEASTTDPAL